MPGATLLVTVRPGDDSVRIDASAACGTSDVMAPGSFSWHVLSSLTDEVSTFSDGVGPSGDVFGISMTTRRVSSLR